jgi:hypothetical protein
MRYRESNFIDALIKYLEFLLALYIVGYILFAFCFLIFYFLSVTYNILDFILYHITGLKFLRPRLENRRIKIHYYDVVIFSFLALWFWWYFKIEKPQDDRDAQEQIEAKVRLEKEWDETSRELDNDNNTTFMIPPTIDAPKVDTLAAQLIKIDSNTNPQLKIIASTSPKIDSAVNAIKQLLAEIISDTTMVFGGSFQMGSTLAGQNASPIHKVNVETFYITKNLITQEQWMMVMGYNPSQNSCDNCPITNISWYDVQIFIKKLNELTNKEFRLPTEAEWEYTARGGNKSANYLYAGTNDFNEIRSRRAGQKIANELGIYDMTGVA